MAFLRHSSPTMGHSTPQESSLSLQWSTTSATSRRAYHPQGNREAERAVATINNLLKEGDYPYKALLAYRTTPLQRGYSPSQLLMGHVLRTTVPTTRAQQKPHIPDLTSVKIKDQSIKKRQKKNVDSHHRGRELPPMEPGDHVWMPGRERVKQRSREKWHPNHTK